MPNKLPSGWQYKLLCEIGEAYTGNTPSTKDKNNYGNDYLFVTPADIKGNKYITDSERKLSSKGFSIARQFKKGDILYVSIGSTIGKIAIANKELTTNQQINVLRVNKNNNNEFVYYQLIHSFRSFSYLISTQAVPILNKTAFENISILIPPIDEQKRIADILSLCDDAIENLNTLIEKKELYKKGVMQKVLTGEVRFKGFKDEWQTVKLGDLATITSAGVDKKINTDEKKVRLLNYLDVFNRNKLYDNEISFITSANDTQIEKCNIKKGDLFITPSSEDREGIAKSAVAMEDFDNVVYSYHIIRLRFNKEIDLKFKSYMCDTELFHRQAYRLCDGSGQRYVISLGTFREMKIYIPTSIGEQKKIGEFLSTIDNEIDNLKKQLELRKQQKKGLMQKLLTGEVRV